MIRKDFKITAHTAHTLSRMRDLETIGMGFLGEEARPFQIRWPSSSDVIFTNADGQRDVHASRYVLPSLFFNDTLIARLGFRNKDGFILFTGGLPEEIEHACAARFRRLTEEAPRHVKNYDREMESLRERADEILSTDVNPALTRGWRHGIEVDPIRAGAAFADFFAQFPDVRTTSRTNGNGVFEAMLTSPTSPCTLTILKMNWAKPRYANESVRANLSMAFTAGKVESEWAQGFVTMSLKRHEHVIRQKAGHVQGDANTADVLRAVQTTDFGYL